MPKRSVFAAVAVLATTLGLMAPASGTAVGMTPAVKVEDRLSSAAATADSVRVIGTTLGDPSSAADFARQLGAKVTWEYSLIDGFAATVPTAALGRLAERDDIEKLWLDQPTTTVMDQSHKAIEAQKAWASGFDGAGITVAVIDTGIDKTNLSLAPAIVGCVSTIGGAVTPECTDSDGHGTHVAGTVASRSTTYPGIAPKASLVGVRVLHAAGTGFSSDIIAGMQWVAANKNKVSPPIRVATMSVGYSRPGCGTDSNPDAKAANALVNAGLVFTVAAGNSGHAKCTIDGSSAASKVITVAASDHKDTPAQGDDVIASFSSGGSSANNKPDITYPGVNITSTFIGGGVLVATMSGTSMATPHAAGVAALLLDKEPGLTATGVKSRFSSTAVKTSKTGSSFNYVYGHGLGNACRTLQLAGCA